MDIRHFAFVLVYSLLVAGCATGKSVRDVQDIRDTGKSNIVVLTYDFNIYTTEKYPSVKSTRLNFYCPENSKLTTSSCFSVTVPYQGRKDVDGYLLHAFESSGAKVMDMKYGGRSVTGANHSVIVDKLATTSCYYNKKKKREICNPVIEDVKDRHRAAFTEAIPVTVSPGSGCNLGHISLTMVDSSITGFDFVPGDGVLDAQKLSNLSGDVNTTVQDYVDRPCV